MTGHCTEQDKLVRNDGDDTKETESDMEKIPLHCKSESETCKSRIINVVAFFTRGGKVILATTRHDLNQEKYELLNIIHKTP